MRVSDSGPMPVVAGINGASISVDLRERVVAAVVGSLSRRQTALGFGVSAASAVRR